ncbi:MAG: PilZ domain-containing protein [Candidatus Aceula meridiana]|nr:PilZ domain-containing protein [Candidatus Aceula meridiana]
MFLSDQNQSERRIHQRFNFKEPVSFRFPDTEESGGCLGQDISEGGLRITFNHFVRPRTQVSLNFRLKEDFDPLETEAKVAWAHRVPCSDRYQLGIEFENKGTQSQDSIRQYIKSNRVR